MQMKYPTEKKRRSPEKSMAFDGLRSPTTVYNQQGYPSNQDVLLKFLHLPGTLFIRHLLDLQDTSPHFGRRCLTGEFLDESEIESHRKRSSKSNYNHQHDHSKAFSGLSSKTSQISRRTDEPKHLPAKIVVLKPDNIGKLRNSTGNVLPIDFLQERSDFRELRTRTKKSLDKEVSLRRGYEDSSHATGITRQMRNGNLKSKGHESSWSSTMGHKRPSSNKESSISREAKKRLSERWKKTRNCEDKGVLSNGRTLADMFAAHDKEVIMAHSDALITEEGFLNKSPIDEQFARGAEPLGISSNDGFKDGSSQLTRSRSLPSSLTEFGSPKTMHLPNNNGRNRDLISREIKGKKKKATKSDFDEEIQVIRVRDDFVDGNSSEMSSTDSESSFLSVDNRTPNPQISVNLTDFMSRTDNSRSSHQEQLVPQKWFSEESPPPSHKSVAALESGDVLKESDQPSPVSVLEPAFRDDLSSCSECFDCVSADFQGLRMQDPLSLNLESEASADSPNEGSIGPLDKAKESWEFSYLSEILNISGLNNANPQGFLSKCYSSDQPINPLIFDQLEKKQSHRTYTASSDRRLLFDLVNSGIQAIGRQFTDPHRWVKSARTAQSAATWMKDGLHISLCKFLETQKNQIDRDDVVNEARWLDLGDEIDEIGEELERMVMDELFAEIYSDNVMKRFLEELKWTSNLW